MKNLERLCFIFLLWILLPSSSLSLETQVKNGTLDAEYKGHINNSIEIVYQFFVTSADFHQDEGSHNALRAYARSDDSDLDEPVTIVVKQKRGVLSWELPSVIGSEKYTFARRTLCPYEKTKTKGSRLRLVGGEKESEKELITISVSTASSKSVNFAIKLYIQSPFQLTMNQTYDLPNNYTNIYEVLSPSSPIFYYFEFEETQDSALIKLTSADTLCMILSIQDASCPVLDLNRNVKFSGTYETIDKLGGIYFTKSTVTPKGVYIVFLVKDNDKTCHSLPPNSFTASSNHLLGDAENEAFIARQKQVSFSITNKITQQEYWLATFGAIGMFFGAYIIVFIVSLGCFIHSSRARRRQDQVIVDDRQPIFQHNDESVISNLSTSPNEFHTAIDVHHHVLSDNPNDMSFERSPTPPPEGTINDIEVLNRSANVIDSLNVVEPPSGLVDPLSEDSSVDELDIDTLPDADFEKDIFRTKITLHVSDLARKSSRVLSKKSNLYFYNLATIAIFYGLPVIQLVLTFQQLTNSNGNKDVCYYNFLCAHPWGKLSDFNHVFSNLGYVMLGVLFMICTKRKQTMTKQTHSTSTEHRLISTLNSTRRLPPRRFGIPQHFGMYYAMGLGLIMEGIMSACYHVCPSHVNFQFDTAFMYTISILILLKIYQTRHPDINANAYKACGVLAFIIFISVVGVKYGSGNQYFWIFFTTLHLLTCMFLSLQIYYMGRFRLDMGIFKRCWLTLKNDVHAICHRQWYGLKPLYPTRMVLLLIMNSANWGISIYGAVHEASKRNADFASFLLAILMSNVILYTSFYIVMKLRHGEKITCEPAFYILVSIFTWAGAGWFFFHNSTSWKLPPAESRRLNTDCELFNFYGKNVYSNYIRYFFVIITSWGICN